MKRVAALSLFLALWIHPLQPAMAKDITLGGGVYTTTGGIIPTFRLVVQDTYLIDFGLSFSTIDTNNFGVLFRGAGRVTELDDVQIHIGGEIGIGEIANATSFEFGIFGGAEAYINDAFSVTADVAPFKIQADGETEALFLRGDVGLNIYFR